MSTLTGRSLQRSPLRRVTRRAPCPICGRPDWCSVAEDGGLAICMRVSDGEHHVAVNGGHVHVLGRATGSGTLFGEEAGVPPDVRAAVERGIERTPSPWRASLALALGLPAGGDAALARMRCYREREHVAAFPMWAHGRPCGVRYRSLAGRKWSMRGGREGLFLSADLARGPEVVVVVEGPTDAAAVLALGIAAIGRPSCRGAVAETVHCVRVLQPRQIVVLLDRDGPGIAGGVDLARALAPACREVRCALPPSPHKDARAWIANGTTRDDVLAVCLSGRRLRVPHG